MGYGLEVQTTQLALAIFGFIIIFYLFLYFIFYIFFFVLGMYGEAQCIHFCVCLSFHVILDKIVTKKSL